MSYYDGTERFTTKEKLLALAIMFVAAFLVLPLVTMTTGWVLRSAFVMMTGVRLSIEDASVAPEVGLVLGVIAGIFLFIGTLVRLSDD